MTASFLMCELDRNSAFDLEPRPLPKKIDPICLKAGVALPILQASMSVIHGPRPVVAGFDTAAYAMRGALHRFERASAEVARQGKNLSAGVDGDEQKSNPLAQTPPNPGPPGGAVPADLAEAMVRQNLSVRDLGANAKMVQAFDAMLAELTRLGKAG